MGIKSLTRRIYLRWLRFKSPTTYAREIGVTVGERCKLVSVHGGTFGSEPYLIRLGDHVEITSGVSFITHDGGAWVFRDEHPTLDVLAPIIVEDNVFIGQNSIVLPGTVIGANCVVGAGSVVRGALKANSVYAGVPVRRIKDLSDYQDGLLSRDLGIKKLSPEAKRAFLVKHFGS
jgi:acetyltransferase-like isoleucine patch superfamily enzyme